MYGFQKDVNLSFLIGKEICFIGIGSYDVQFGWGTGGISVTNKLIYRPAGQVEGLHWNGQNEDVEVAARTVRLLKASITGVKWETDGTLRLNFSNGDQLELFDDEKYEAYTIQDGKDPTILV